MKRIVGVADMKVSSDPDDVIVTHALGSCLGIMAYDPVAQVGGLLHAMLPLSSANPDKARANPCMFVDTGVPMLFKKIYAEGGSKPRLVVKVAGGANVHNVENDRFAIGKRNYIVLKKLFWKNGILIDAEACGGSIGRTLHMEVATGRVWVSTNGEKHEL